MPINPEDVKWSVDAATVEEIWRQHPEVEIIPRAPDESTRIVIWERLDLLSKPSHERRTSDPPAIIVIGPTAKIRIFADRRYDEWPALFRCHQEPVSDHDWYASPGPEWTQRVKETSK